MCFTKKHTSAAFGTENVQDCAKIIVEKGELQLTANERKEFIEKKRAEIGACDTSHSVASDERLRGGSELHPQVLRRPAGQDPAPARAHRKRPR